MDGLWLIYNYQWKGIKEGHITSGIACVSTKVKEFVFFAVPSFHRCRICFVSAAPQTKSQMNV